MGNNVFIKLYDNEYKILKEIEEITGTDYEVKDLIKVENLISIIEDMKIAYERIKEQYEDYKEDIQENYKLTPKENNYE